MLYFYLIISYFKMSRVLPGRYNYLTISLSDFFLFDELHFNLSVLYRFLLQIL